MEYLNSLFASIYANLDLLPDLLARVIALQATAAIGRQRNQELKQSGDEKPLK
jgi:hypothetical protein